MSDTTTQQRPTLADLTGEQPESSDSGYLEWKRAKIEKARDEARRNPAKLKSHAEMRARLGIER